MSNYFKVDFGLEARKSLFYLDPNSALTNHGSYGTTPRLIREKRLALQLQMEQNPDKWFKLDSYKLWQDNLSSLAQYLNVNIEKLVFASNATDAINSVLRAVSFRSEDEVLLATEYTYAAILNAIDYKCHHQRSWSVEVFKFPIKYPIESKKTFLAEFDKFCHELVIEKKKKIRLAVLDHISSASATLYPVKEMIEIIRKLNNSEETLVLVDGAHCIGQIDIKLNDLNCDFYVSNLHKWFMVPRGCSFLYVNNKNFMEMQPSYISHGYKANMSYNFWYRATSDLSHYYVTKDCIDFYENNLGGLKNITKYTETVLNEACAMLCAEWKTERLQIPKEMEAPFMKNIKLPPLKDYAQVNRDNQVKMVAEIWHKHQCVSMITIIDQMFYCRISCHVYNEMSDYVRLKNAILTMIA